MGDPNPPATTVISPPKKGKKGAASSSAGTAVTTTNPLQNIIIQQTPSENANTTTVGDKKLCLWPTGDGTTCGKSFTKADSLRRHMAETHKGQNQ